VEQPSVYRFPYPADVIRQVPKRVIELMNEIA